MNKEDLAAKIYEHIKDFDPIQEAEDRFNGDTGAMLALSLRHNNIKAQILGAMGDTSSRSTFQEAFDLCTKLGFEEIYKEYMCNYDPERDSWDKTNIPALDTYMIMWNPMGLLCTLESYWGGRSINSIKIYGNWRGDRNELSYGISNGPIWPEDSKWEGEPIAWYFDFDAREGLQYNLSQMATKGIFLPEWLECPFLWLLNYTESDQDHKDYDYGLINKRKFEKFPKHVQEAMTSKNIRRTTAFDSTKEK